MLCYENVKISLKKFENICIAFSKEKEYSNKINK